MTRAKVTSRRGTVSKTKSKPKASARKSRTASQSAGARSSEALPKGAGDWREAMLARVRALIVEAVPDVVEERKWKKPSNGMKGVPVWSRGGIVCTGETYAKAVKLTFAHGASLPDPARLFNASLEGNMRRAIDLHEGDSLDARAFATLIRAAVARNEAPRSPAPKTTKPKTAPKPLATSSKASAAPVVLLSGGNPQIARAAGDAPVQAYIAAIPAEKRALGSSLDALITRTVPGVKKAVKWNSPFYGVEGQGWFLSFHVFTGYVKVAFFRGTSLKPVPPGPSKNKETRYVDLYVGSALDEAQLRSWVEQAAALPGWIP